MSKHNELGKYGEIFGIDFLINLGYKIVTTNYRYGHKEIDIIAQDENTIVFVEVKTRTNTSFGLPESYVNAKKKENTIIAANHYLEQYNTLVPSRFDIISIIIDRDSHALIDVTHFIDAYY